MNSYKIRTRNVMVIPYMVAGVVWPCLLGSRFGGVFDKLTHDATNRNYAIAFLFLFVILHQSCCYFVCTNNGVTTSAEGIHAKWSQDFPYFDKIEKTIKWEDIVDFSINGSLRFFKEIIVRTKTGETYKLICWDSMFSGHKSRNLCIADIKTHVPEAPYNSGFF